MSVSIAFTQTTKDYKGFYIPVKIDSQYCFNYAQYEMIGVIMVERNSFKLELSEADSIYNDEVRKYNTLDSIVKTKDYEINLLDSVYKAQREINLNLEKKNKTLKTVTIASVCVAIVSVIFTILK